MQQAEIKKYNDQSVNNDLFFIFKKKTAANCDCQNFIRLD